MTNEDNLKLLDLQWGPKSLREMGGIEFMQYILSRLNEAKAFNPEVSSLTQKCNVYPGKEIPPETKVELLIELRNIIGTLP